MEFVKYEPDLEAEQEWLDDDPTTSLVGAAVLVPKGSQLSSDAIETIRHFRYYRNAQDAFVLFSDRVVAFVDAGDFEEMVRKAKREADAVTGSMPDFTPYNMDDGCGMLHMNNAHVFAFRPCGIDNGLLFPALEARQECLEACEKSEVVAVVYCDAGDCE